jgi:hypothetical protein
MVGKTAVAVQMNLAHYAFFPSPFQPLCRAGRERRFHGEKVRGAN